jgi:hypothetical protein
MLDADMQAASHGGMCPQGGMPPLPGRLLAFFASNWLRYYFR